MKALNSDSKNNIKPSTVIAGCSIIALALFASIAYATSLVKEGVVLPETEIVAPPGKSACLAAYDLAEIVMNMRQAGVPLPGMIEAATSDKGGDVMLVMVEDAYARPLYEMEDNKDRAVKTFAESWYATCKAQERRK